MDEALVARFEEWFRETARQIAAVREETVREIASLRQETASRFDQTTQEIAGLREETGARFDQTTQEISRQIAAVREETVQGIASLREETVQGIASLREETSARFDQVTRRLDQNEETARHTLVLMENLRDEFRLVAEAYLGVNEKVERYHSQSTLTVEQIAGLVQPVIRDMDRRLNTLEGWKGRQEGDVLDAVRKLLERLSLQRAAKSSP